MKTTPPKVIYLFPEEEAAEASRPDSDRDVAHDTGEGPPAELYSSAQVEKLLAIPMGRLRYWARVGLVVPSARRGRRRFYTFQDLVGLRAAKGLLRSGMKASQIERAIHALQEKLPDRNAPLSELRLSQEGRALVVQAQSERFEAESGQLVFDFDVKELRKQVVQLIRFEKMPGTERRQRAFDCYLEGCRYETRPEDIDQAESAYRQAIELDPELACAYTNLGNLRYRAGAADDARVLYERAAKLEPEQPEAQHNLAFLTYEEGDYEGAVELFQRALHIDPDFADAHFNLAMALVELDREHEAATHFRAYLELEPEGPWAELARNELQG